MGGEALVILEGLRGDLDLSGDEGLRKGEEWPTSLGDLDFGDLGSFGEVGGDLGDREVRGGDEGGDVCSLVNAYWLACGVASSGSNSARGGDASMPVPKTDSTSSCSAIGGILACALVS